MRLILLMLMAFPALAGTIQFKKDFENGQWSDTLATNFSSANGGAAISNNPAIGTSSVKIYINWLSGADYRAELLPKNGANIFNFNQEYWIVKDVYYQNWVNDTGSTRADGINPFQVHNRYTTSTGGISASDPCALGNAVGNGPFLMQSDSSGPTGTQQIYTFAGTLFPNGDPDTNQNHVAWSGALLNNQWQKWVFHFKITRIGDPTTGFIEVWRNGTKLFREDKHLSFPYDYQGSLKANMISQAITAGCKDSTITTVRKPIATPSYQTGLYLYGWKGGSDSVKSRVMFIDNMCIVIGGGGDTYNSTLSLCGQSSGADTIPPTITAIASTPSNRSATITFTTDEQSDTRIEYGTTTAYGLVNPPNTAMVTSHSATLTGLTPSTTYHYRIRSKDAAGNEQISADQTFTTTADPVLTITNVAKSAITTTQAVITWTTNLAATSYAECGTTINYGINVSDSAYVTSHSLTITGLSAKTHYYCRVRSVDATPVTKYSPLFTLDTPTASGLESDSFSLLEWLYAS